MRGQGLDWAEIDTYLTLPTALADAAPGFDILGTDGGTQPRIYGMSLVYDPTGDITIDGSGVLSGIGTSNIVVDNRQVPIGANAVVNSEFTRGKFGWRWRGGGFESEWGVNLPTWFGQRNVIWARIPGTVAIGVSADLSPDALWGGGSLANAPLFAMPVAPGDRLIASVLAAEHRCTFQLYILIFDGAGSLIGAPVVGNGTPLGAANGDPANFTRLSVFQNSAPANSRWAIPMIRLLGTGGTDPYIFFTEPMLSKVAQGQTVVPPYVPGRADPNADVTATAQRSIVPQFPVIEIKQGEAGSVGNGNRTVTHVAKRALETLTGGTWDEVSQNVGTGTVGINASTGLATIANISISGAYVIKYIHTDGIETEHPVNVLYVPAPPAAGASVQTVGFQQIITKALENGSGVFLNAQLARLAGGNSGTITCRIERRELGVGTWTTAFDGPGSFISASEPGSDFASGTFVNTTGSKRVFEFRMTEVRSPGTAGGAQVASQTFLEG
ncbi:hypothetical protein [Erythrobacter sp.]|uniref:hypothetical protein n=1 Tax=Erythrobacter sp. TaxID=1042 RepID=UPI0025E7637F|nr:hypothetical protein [Erythrobacter sp.]